MKNLNELKSCIESWSIDRGLNNAEPKHQMLKLMEEVGELSSGIVKCKQDEIIDGIGDVFVVMTILCQQLGLDMNLCVQSAYEQIKERKGKMLNGIFVKDSDINSV